MLRCQHLVDYSRWLCLELMEVKPPEQSKSTQFNLTKAKQTEARREREQYLEKNSIIESSGISQCRKLIKDLERCRTTKEKQQLGYFLVRFF